MTLAVNASTGATSTQRFLPYGAPRSGAITATDRGWIGQTKDASTGLQYLNARYYDPTIGRFTARDPLADLSVPATLDAYGYAGGTPVTAKDPTGLLCEGDNPCGRSRTSGKPVCTGACRPPGINYRVPPHSYNADGQEKSFTIGRHPGAGQVTIGLFISDASTGIGIKGFGLYGSGNDREASPWAHPSRHKFFAILDFETGKGWAYVSPSCDPGGNKCDGASAFSTNFGKTADLLSRIPGVGKSNGLKVTEEAGLIEVRYSLRNSRYPSLSSTIDGEIELQAFDGDVSVINVDRDNYPTLEIYRYEDYYSGTGAVETLAGAPQGNIWELMQLWPGGGS
jgi:RHS repeat-associated protein